MIREKLAQMFAGVETCTQMLYDITYNMISMGSQGAEVGARIALLKYQTTRMNHLVADNAVQASERSRKIAISMKSMGVWVVVDPRGLEICLARCWEVEESLRPAWAAS